MFLFRRILSLFLAVVASLVSIIGLAIINSITHSGLTGGQVVLYGLVGGIVMGLFAGYFLVNYIIKKTRQFVVNKFGNTLQRFAFLRRI